MDQGIDQRNILIFYMKISIPAIAVSWRNDTHNLCHLTMFIEEFSSSLNLFVLWFFILVLYIDFLDKWHTSAFNALIWFSLH